MSGEQRDQSGQPGFPDGMRPLDRDDANSASHSGLEPGPRREPIAQQVVDRITGMIRSGNLRAGEKLPTETQMALAFAISRPPLREALKALTIMGLLESRQGGRYHVTDLSPSRLVAPFATMLSQPDYDFAVHFEARALIDMELARLCTRRASAEAKARILRLAQDGLGFSDPVAFRLLDAEFHEAVAEGAGNPLLMSLSQGLYDLQLDLRRVATTLPGVLEMSARQHMAIATAIMAGDDEAAARAIRDHLEHVSRTTELARAAAALPETD